jgi:branched-chain amino acid transport system substrate-binding protein
VAGIVGLTLLGSGCAETGPEGVGEEKSVGADAGSGAMTIYAGLPVENQGKENPQSEQVFQGMQLALKQAGNRAGSVNIALKRLDDAGEQQPGWDAGKTILNARKVARDRTTIAYLGDLNSGAAAAALPVLNEVKIPQIGYSTTATGLTKDAEGADEGEPGRYYPSSERTFVRIPPRDAFQGAVMSSAMTAQGCREIAVLNDKEVYGAGLANVIEASAKRDGLKVVESMGIDTSAGNYEGVARKLSEQSIDCVAFAGSAHNNAVRLFEDLAAGLSSATLFGSDGVATPAVFDPREQGVSDSTGARMRLVSPALPPEQYGARGKKFFDDYKAEFGTDPTDPYAIYGFEGMSLALDAIKRAGVQGRGAEAIDKREGVKAQLFATKGRQSALGFYNVDPEGDSSLKRYGLYTVQNGNLSLERTLEPPAE